MGNRHLTLDSEIWNGAQIRQRRRTALVAVFLVIASMAVCAIGLRAFLPELFQRPFRQPGISQTREYVNDSLTPAVVEFVRQEGHLPARLEDLVPRYLPDIERPKAGNKAWIYSAETSGESFSILFGYGEHFYPYEWLTVQLAPDGTIVASEWLVNY